MYIISVQDLTGCFHIDIIRTTYFRHMGERSKLINYFLIIRGKRSQVNCISLCKFSQNSARKYLFIIQLSNTFNKSQYRDHWNFRTTPSFIEWTTTGETFITFSVPQ